MRVFNVFSFVGKGLRKPVWLPVMAMLILLFSFQGAWANVVIDDFDVTQALISAPGPATSSASSVATGPVMNIVGGDRYLQVDLTQGAMGEQVTAQVTGGDYSNSFDAGTRGQALISWSGDGDPTSFNLGLNLCGGMQFDVEFLANDHTINYIMRIYQSDGTMSSQTISVPAGIVSSTIVPYPFANFSPLANFDCSDIGRIELFWDTEADDQDALDNIIDLIEVEIEEPEFMCNFKTFDGQKNLVLPVATTFPHVITAQVSISNTGMVDIPAGTMTVVDDLAHLGAGLSYLPGTTLQTAGPGGVIVGDPAGSPGPVLTWTSMANFPAGATVVFQYDVEIAALTDTQTLGNDVVVSVDDVGISNNPNCEATVRIPREVVPAMNEWGALLAVLGVTLLGIYLYRRRTTRV